MKKEEETVKISILSAELIREKIYIIRGQKVMLDKDLALLYGVSTKRLNEAVKRNPSRFPDDFMFRLKKLELEPSSRSQFATLKKGRGKNIKYEPLAFTEQGIAMLSSVLNSDRAIAVNIQVIRIFTQLRQMIDAYKELREKMKEMEEKNETNFKEIFRVLRAIMTEEEKPRKKIGFSAE